MKYSGFNFLFPPIDVFTFLNNGKTLILVRCIFFLIFITFLLLKLLKEDLLLFLRIFNDSDFLF